jgi:dipeptidase D
MSNQKYNKMSEILNLEPKAVWKNFYSLTQIPRPSKKEAKVIAFLKKFGEDLNLETIVDHIGNVVIRKPATPGMEDRKMVVLQGHIDMVPQKNSDVVHDFEKDPIQTYIDNEWVTARGTTLGADNGMGVAATMAMLESTDIEHPAIEALFTVDEETGMTGAEELKPNFLKGDILMNLDSEDEGELYVGCAGGVDVNVSNKLEMEANPYSCAYRVHVKGLKGGHSGMDISLGRANANKLLFRAIQEAAKVADLRIATVNGGDLRNAIPRESIAIISVVDDKAKAFESKLKTTLAGFVEEYKGAEDSLDLVFETCEKPKSVLSAKNTKDITTAVVEALNGVVKMSDSMEGLIETSSNLAIVSLSETGDFNANCLTRSSVDSEKIVAANKIKSSFDTFGCEVKFEGQYPGWKPNMDSEILSIMQGTYRKLYDHTPEIKAIHAGLECGLLGSVYTNWDMISFGPTIRFPHSPDEKVNIESVGRFWNWLTETMKHIPKK